MTEGAVDVDTGGGCGGGGIKEGTRAAAGRGKSNGEVCSIADGGGRRGEGKVGVDAGLGTMGKPCESLDALESRSCKGHRGRWQSCKRGETQTPHTCIKKCGWGNRSPDPHHGPTNIPDGTDNKGAGHPHGANAPCKGTSDKERGAWRKHCDAADKIVGGSGHEEHDELSPDCPCVA